MSDSRPVQLSSEGPPTTVLDPEPAEARAALAEALAAPVDQRRAAVSAVVARWPRYLDAWAQLGALARDDVEAYAAYRVGYHRRDRGAPLVRGGGQGLGERGPRLGRLGVEHGGGRALRGELHGTAVGHRATLRPSAPWSAAIPGPAGARP